MLQWPIEEGGAQLQDSGVVDFKHSFDSSVFLVRADWMPGCLGSSCSCRGASTGYLRAFPAENAGRRASQGQIPPWPECAETHTDHFQVSPEAAREPMQHLLLRPCTKWDCSCGSGTENVTLRSASVTCMGCLELWVLWIGGSVFLRALQFFFLFVES